MEDISNSSKNNSAVQPIDPTQHVSPSDPNSLAGEQYEKEGLSPEDLDSRWLRWKCMNCGYVYEGVKELKKCPRCGNENPDLFEDAD